MFASCEERCYDVQIESVRRLKYTFFPKDKSTPRHNLLAAVVIFLDSEEPQFYLIPSMAWLEPNALLVSHDHEGKKSKPEWGLKISRKNLCPLAHFKFEEVLQTL